MSSITIKNVAIVGGSGKLGSYILNELLAAGFNVTALSRESSTATFPASVAVKKVNYDSLDSLKEALTGIDAVVSAIATPAIGSQIKLIDAANAAGVKRFIPSEYGIDTRNLGGAKIGQILAGKIKTVDYLQEKAKENSNFTWTGIATGFFFDLNLQLGIFGLNAKTKTAEIYDSGNEPFPTSNVSFIGRAVAAVLKRPAETANKYIAVASFQPTRNQILQIVEEETGTKWTVKHVSTDELKKIGEEKLAKGDYSAFGELVRVHLYRDGEGHALKPGESANELLGLPAEEDLRASLKEWLKKEGVSSKV